MAAAGNDVRHSDNFPCCFRSALRYHFRNLRSNGENKKRGGEGGEVGSNKIMSANYVASAHVGSSSTSFLEPAEKKSGAWHEINLEKGFASRRLLFPPFILTK
jgi:hypothetical protein